MTAQLRKAELYASLHPPAWYAVSVYREYRARDDLAKLNIGDVWLPECKVVTSKRRKRITVDGPLFPGYLFVRGVMEDRWLANVLSVRDVADFLRMQARPVAAQERQIANLRRLVDEGGGRVLIEAGVVKRKFGHVDETAFKPEQQVMVIDGPFTGLNGIYKEPAGDERLKIFLDIFGRVTEVRLHEASVEAVA